MLDTSCINKIISIEPNSIAEELDIRPGSFLVEINHEKINDYFDYTYQINQENILLTILEGENLIDFEIEKDFDEDLGLIFENDFMDEAKSCDNHCVFCFIDQLPKGLRSSLYFKDDDTRLSFMHGNFVTLTNLNRLDLERIVRLGIHPINISVHTTNPQLRQRMIGNKNAGDILNKIKFLADNKVKMNAQIVLVPNMNDGIELENTIKDLYQFYPYMRSVAVVPVGLTRFRNQLFRITPVDTLCAQNTIQLINKLQSFFIRKGSRFVFAADEFYLKANIPFPSATEYENFEQYEDGIGMISKFSSEFDSLLANSIFRFNNHTFITGTAFYPTLKKHINKVNAKYSITNDVLPINNDFFGHSITVNGLLTWADIEKNTCKIEQPIVVCDNILNIDEITIDGMSKSDIVKKRKGQIEFVSPDASSLFVKE